MDLAARIVLQRAKIVALEREAEERRRREARQTDDRRREVDARRLAKVRQREQRQQLLRQQEEQRRRDRDGRDESVMQAHLQHKAADLARRAENELLYQRRLSTEEDRRRALFHQQEEQRRRDRQARDESGMRAHLRHEATELERKARQAEARRQPESYKSAKLRDTERKRVFRQQQDEERRLGRQARDESSMQAHLRHEAVAEAQKLQGALLREVAFRNEARDRAVQKALRVDERRAVQRLQDDRRQQDRDNRDRAGLQAHLRHDALVQAQWAQQRSQAQVPTLAFDGVLPSFLDQEYQYLKVASINFPEIITPTIQMECMRAYQRAISDASRRLPCGICGGLFQEDDITRVGLQDEDLQYFIRRTETAPDSCAVKDGLVGLCSMCNVAIVKRKIPPLSAGNFVNCLFCQDYPEVLKDLNTVEEAFIARAHVLGVFLKLTSGAKRGMSYRGSRGHSVAVRQDPSGLLKILTRRLRDHTTITVSWDRGTPPSEENLARFCSVNKEKVLNALLWLCANNPVYRSVAIDYSVLDSWPDHHIPQEIRDAFIALGSEAGSNKASVTDEREGYATSLQDGLFENDLDAEVEDAEPGSILSRSFFSDLHGQEAHPTPATLRTLQAIIQETSDCSLPIDNGPRDDEDSDETPDDDGRPPHISYKTSQDLPLINSFTEPDYFTAAFPTLFPFGIGGHLGDGNGNRPETISLKAFARYAMLHHSLL